MSEFDKLASQLLKEANDYGARDYKPGRQPDGSLTLKPKAGSDAEYLIKYCSHYNAWVLDEPYDEENSLEGYTMQAKNYFLDGELKADITCHFSIYGELISCKPTEGTNIKYSPQEADMMGEEIRTKANKLRMSTADNVEQTRRDAENKPGIMDRILGDYNPF
jgi:hypothetical protein